MKYEIWHMAAGKSFGSQTWTGDARLHNPFYERSVRDSLTLFSLR